MHKIPHHLSSYAPIGRNSVKMNANGDWPKSAEMSLDGMTSSGNTKDLGAEGSAQAVACGGSEATSSGLAKSFKDMNLNEVDTVGAGGNEAMKHVIATSFEDMDLKESLLRGIYAYGFEKPTVIQQRSIIPCIEGHDVIA
ncbi:hypothetical protein Pcinc_041347 [Petrolisthes cinctipes]|uniref:RNA helicase n=1 Tax=Petrolisthes cinctipes TaxID=88211 RepID=A0AAE1BJR0_PETCI|nr:hypothetical protein Pcinc_041347 [Petrolisthes cinctipes]